MDDIARTRAPSPRPRRAGLPAVPSRLVDALTPFTRTSGFYARSWRRYLARDHRDDVPLVRPGVALAGQAFLDELVLAGFRMIRPAIRDAEDLARNEREVRDAIERYAAAGWLDRPGEYFVTPPPLQHVASRTVRGRRLVYERVSFDSEYAPHDGEPGRERWLGYAANRRARAWVLRHHEPRPWLVCVHGAAMGRPDVDLAVFRARWLHEDLALNVALPVLPLHGPRAATSPPRATFPGEDVLDNIHGAAQAVWDIRRLLSWIAAQEPGMPIGLNGLSLGSYISALVASVDDRLTCAILGVPAVDVVDLIEQHAGAALDGERRRIVDLARQAGRVVSPLALAPRVAPEGRYIYAGLADRLVHPRRQVIRLWEHWGRPDIAWYEGGHTGFFRAKPVGQFVRDALRRSGFTAPVDARRADARA